MSDGALSQDEIDALLSGGDMGGGASSPGDGGKSTAGTEENRAVLESFLTSTAPQEAANLSTMTGAKVSLRGPQVSFTNRDALLGQLPGMVTVIRADYSSGFPGEHIFVLPEGTAKAICSLMNKEDNITLDAMAMSVIGEVISQFVGTQITALSNRTGNKTLAATPPQAANVPKAAAALPAGDFTAALYQLDLGDGTAHQMWEIYGDGGAAEIAKSLSGAGGAPKSGGSGGVGAGVPGIGAMAGAMPGAYPGYPQGGPIMGGTMGPNVQAVQFPNLMPKSIPQEQGNINLIMDVYMELTVELGRTRKLIKEILGMGEGTIIELDKLAGEPVDILVNHKLIAKGEVVVIDENFGVRVTEIVSPVERVNDLS